MFVKKFHPKIKSDLKKLDKQVVRDIKDIHLNKIATNPYEFPKLKGNLSNFQSYHFRKNRVDYRIIYEVIDNQIILYMMIAKRENLYNNLLKRV